MADPTILIAFTAGLGSFIAPCILPMIPAFLAYISGTTLTEINNDQKTKFNVSDFQKSERDFAFVVDKKVNAQEIINIVSSVDVNLISNIKVFDVYEGTNIPENQKSIAVSVTIQSPEKTLNDSDLEKINKLIVQAVENKTGAKIRS